MLGRALDAGTPTAWVTADEPYGHDSKFRRFLGQRGIGYVLSIPRSQPIHTGSSSSQFGYKAQIVDNTDGVIVDCTVERGNPSDAPQLVPAIARIARRTADHLPR